MPLFTKIDIESLAGHGIAPGAYFGPCSGRDLPVAFKLCGNSIEKFVFCDLTYTGRRATASGMTPKDWSCVSRISGLDQMQEPKSTWYGRRSIRPFVTHEVWRRPDGSEVTIELRRDLAQDVLEQRFAPRSISVFLHHRDSTGEGGSDIWFLKDGDPDQANQERGQCLLSKVAGRLVDGAIVITDAVLAEPEFGYGTPFRAAGVLWKPLGVVDRTHGNDPISRAWRATRA